MTGGSLFLNTPQKTQFKVVKNIWPIFVFYVTRYRVLGDVVKYIFKTKIIRKSDVFCFRETVNIFHYFA